MRPDSKLGPLILACTDSDSDRDDWDRGDRRTVTGDRGRDIYRDGQLRRTQTDIATARHGALTRLGHHSDEAVSKGAVLCDLDGDHEHVGWPTCTAALHLRRDVLDTCDGSVHPGAESSDRVGGGVRRKRHAHAIHHLDTGARALDDGRGVGIRAGDREGAPGRDPGDEVAARGAWGQGSADVACVSEYVTRLSAVTVTMLPAIYIQLMAIIGLTLYRCVAQHSHRALYCHCPRSGGGPRGSGAKD